MGLSRGGNRGIRTVSAVKPGLSRLVFIDRAIDRPGARVGAAPIPRDVEACHLRTTINWVIVGEPHLVRLGAPRVNSAPWDSPEQEYCPACLAISSHHRELTRRVAPRGLLSLMPPWGHQPPSQRPGAMRCQPSLGPQKGHEVRVGVAEIAKTPLTVVVSITRRD